MRTEDKGENPWRNFIPFRILRMFTVLASFMMYAGGAVTAQSLDQLTLQQEKELTVFGIKGGLNMDASVDDIKNRLAKADLEEMIATGINGNGFLCATVLEVRPLTLESKYEVTCIAYRGGSGRKTYIIDALNGIAFEQ